MRSFREDKKKKVVLLCCILFMQIIGLSFLFSYFLKEVNAEFSGTYTPQLKNDDWIIDMPGIVVINKTIILNGNLTVENDGSLILRNVILKINVSFDFQYKIEVKAGGSLIISDFDDDPETPGDSTIITNTGFASFGFIINNDAKFEMKNSELYYCDSSNNKESRGLAIYANNSVIENCTISLCKSIDLIDSSNNLIKNCIISNYTRVGINVRNSSNNSIIDCRIKSVKVGTGIYIRESLDNIIMNCHLLYNSVGIELRKSNDNIIKKCKIIFYKSGFGIILHEASDNNIINCIINASIKHLLDLPEYDKLNRFGIDISWYASNNRIINCIVSDLFSGIELSSYSNNTTINKCNIINNDNCGIYISDSFYNEINKCNISNNRVFGIWIVESIKEKPSSNKIYQNNFISNHNQSNDGGIKNQWNNSDGKGNYWSDYMGLDNGANGRTAGDGIGDTKIPHLGLDNYPLIKPLELNDKIASIEPDHKIDNDFNNVDTGEGMFSSNFGIIAFPVITITLVTFITVFFVTTEIGKYSLYSVFSLLYTKRRKKGDISYIKGSVRGYILGNPGERYNDIKKVLNLPNGTLTYYLNMLERERIIRSERDGFNKRFYPFQGNSTSEKIELTEIQQSIYFIIENNPGISQKKILAQLGISQQRLNYHIKLMTDSRLIRVKHEGKITKCFVIDEVS